MSQKACEGSQLICEATELVRRASGPEVAGGIKSAIGRAARILGWKFSRTYEIWYGRARRIDAHEMDKLRALAREQAEKYERVAMAMRQTDPDFYVEDIAGLVNMARKLRGEDQP